MYLYLCCFYWILYLLYWRKVVALDGQVAWLAQQGVVTLEAVAAWVVLLLPWLLIYVH